jgi:hypothetical protein
MSSYPDLEIYHLAYSLALKIHKLTLGLPKYEMFEQGSQIRRSLKALRTISQKDMEEGGTKRILFVSSFMPILLATRLCRSQI